MDQNIKNLQLETFVFDFENLAGVTFNNSEYEVNQRAIILRKFLIDGHGVIGISNLIQREKLRFLSIGCSEKFELEYLRELKLFLPALNILPVISITNYSAIKLFNVDGSKKKSLQTKNPAPQATAIDLGTYLNEPYLVLDSEYLSRKDVIEYICYGKGAVHYGIDQKKVERLGKVTKLNFYYAMGEVEPDSLFTWATSFHTAELEKQFIDTPELSNFMMKLGEKHSFHTLVQLQIMFELIHSEALRNVYHLCKVYLVENDVKFKKHDPLKPFSLQ